MTSSVPPALRGHRVAYRSILFVPGDRPDRFEKALVAGTDAVCIDLEDAVAPDRKEQAWSSVARFLTEPRGDGPDLMVRVNDPDSELWKGDVAALSGNSPDGLMIPKVRTEDGVLRVDEAFGGRVRLFPLIETCEGLDRVAGIGAATSAVSGLIFGGFDLALELGAEPEWDALAYARGRVVHAAALNRIAAIDMPSRDVADPETLQHEAERARRMGFSGKIAIHPAQVPVIDAIFSPSSEQLEWARRIVSASEGSQHGAVMDEGKMIDRPIVEAARRILARANEGGLR